MALDYFAIVSNGAYPNPLLSPSSTRRAALAASFGLLNIDLPTGSLTSSIKDMMLHIGKSFISFTRGLFRIGAK